MCTFECVSTHIDVYYINGMRHDHLKYRLEETLSLELPILPVMDSGWDPREGLFSIFRFDCYAGCWLL